MPALANREAPPHPEPNLAESEEFLARITQVAYETALRHGIKGRFTDVYLELWQRLRAALSQGPSPLLEELNP